jgi:hypothetical protein
MSAGAGTLEWPPTGRPTANSAEGRQAAASASGGVCKGSGNDLPQPNGT